MQKGRRVPRVRHHEQLSAPVPPDGDHRGIVHVVEFLLHGLVEFLHQSDLLDFEKVSLHELAELLAQ
jgi:hypothetical protein